MGRTGVFITLSIVLERMRYEGVVDIFQTVKMLRTQRPAMVQTEVRRGRGDAPAWQLCLASLRFLSVRWARCEGAVLSAPALGWRGLVGSRHESRLKSRAKK